MSQSTFVILEDGRKVYYGPDGSMRYGEQAVHGAWYYFDTDGFMHTGWLTDTDGKSYYLESVVGTGQGQMVTGERSINGRKYIFDEDGACTNRNGL